MGMGQLLIHMYKDFQDLKQNNMDVKFNPTKKQEKAFKLVIAAINRAKKSGLVFYGKQGSLVAYKKQADDYVNQNEDKVEHGKGKQIIHLGENVLADSGADDYPSYVTVGDEKRYEV